MAPDNLLDNQQCDACGSQANLTDVTWKGNVMPYVFAEFHMNFILKKTWSFAHVLLFE